MQPDQPEKNVRLCAFAGLLLLVLVAYSGVWACGFVSLDDTSHVTLNPLVARGLTWDGVQEAFAKPHASLWVPLTMISFMADVSLFGMEPGPMHVENALWHFGAAVLLLLALARLTGRWWPSAAVAALFAVHPLNVESVAWITERKNTLCAFFFFWSLHAWAGFARSGSWRSWSGALVLFAFALMAKPMAVILPCALLVLDGWPLGRIGRVPAARLLLEKLPFFALAAIVSVVAAKSAAATTVDWQVLPLAPRATNALISYVGYLGDIVWPSWLAPARLHPRVALWPQALGAAAVLAAITALALWQRRRMPWVLAGWLLFLGCLVPSIGIIQAGDQARADRFAYLAATGIFIVLVWTADRLLPQEKRIRIALVAFVFAGLAVRTAVQTSHWKDSRALYEHCAAVMPNNAMAHGLAGTACFDAGDLAQAVRHFERSLELHRDNEGVWRELARTALRLGDRMKTIHALEMVLIANPSDAAARETLEKLRAMEAQRRQ